MGNKRFRNIVVVDDEGSTMLQRKCEQKRAGTYEVKNRVVVEEDHMPKQVATEMLCNPKVRMTNRERKTYERARWTIKRSTLEPKPHGVVIEARLKRTPLEKLVLWWGRALLRRKQLQKPFQKVMEKLGNLPEDDTILDKAAKAINQATRAVLTRQKAALDLAAGRLDSFAEQCEAEIAARA